MMDPFYLAARGEVPRVYSPCAAGAQGKEEKIIQGREYVKLYER